jgi:hypothetical protein
MLRRFRARRRTRPPYAGSGRLPSPARRRSKSLFIVGAQHGATSTLTRTKARTPNWPTAPRPRPPSSAAPAARPRFDREPGRRSGPHDDNLPFSPNRPWPPSSSGGPVYVRRGCVRRRCVRRSACIGIFGRSRRARSPTGFQGSCAICAQPARGEQRDERASRVRPSRTPGLRALRR